MKSNTIFTYISGSLLIAFTFLACGDPSCEQQKQMMVDAHTNIYNDMMALCETADCKSQAWVRMAIGISTAQADYECCLDPNSCYSRSI